MNVPVLENYIGGAWAPSSSDVLLDVTDPAEDAVIAKVPVSTPQEIDRAVGAGAAAFAAWQDAPPPERAQCVIERWW